MQQEEDKTAKCDRPILLIGCFVKKLRLPYKGLHLDRQLSLSFAPH
jgi:hypothetical protein